MNEEEVLATIGTNVGDPTCIFEAPISSSYKDTHLYEYALDYSFRYHGNLCSEMKLHPDAWCLQFTPYCTTHGATWSYHLDNMSASERESFVSSFINAPRSQMLGSGPTMYSV